MEEELWKMKWDYQRQFDDKDRSIEEIKYEKESVERELVVERSDFLKIDFFIVVRIMFMGFI